MRTIRQRLRARDQRLWRIEATLREMRAEGRSMQWSGAEWVVIYSNGTYGTARNRAEALQKSEDVNDQG